MTPTERQEQLKNIYAHLRKLGIVHSQKDLANRLSMSPSNLSQAFNGSATYLTDNFFTYRIGDTFGEIFNPDWLRSGKGDMLRTATPPSQIMGDVNNGTAVQATGGASVQLLDHEILIENARLKAELESLKRENEKLWTILNNRVNN